MLLVWTAVVAGVGFIGGALLPRVAYRMSVPTDDPYRAACQACGSEFRDGFRGWVYFGHRCPVCATRLGPSAWLTAVSAAIAGVGVVIAVGSSPLLPILAVVVLIGVLLAAVDLACMRLPDVLVLPTFAVSAAMLTIISMARGDSTQLVRGFVAAAVLAGAYFVLAIVSGGGVGLGDVKLALILGLLLGWFGWPFVVAGVLIAHLLHGAVAVLALAARRAGRKTLIPMGPALLIGAWCAIAVVPLTISLLK